jgi:hypothetical protein
MNKQVSEELNKWWKPVFIKLVSVWESVSQDHSIYVGGKNEKWLWVPGLSITTVCSIPPPHDLPHELKYVVKLKSTWNMARDETVLHSYPSWCRKHWPDVECYSWEFEKGCGGWGGVLTQTLSPSLLCVCVYMPMHVGGSACRAPQGYSTPRGKPRTISQALPLSPGL